jgi:N-acetylglucosaminyldiphosphoundecaprenol N-acetyl-beta-D-mannosaminyltransferase
MSGLRRVEVLGVPVDVVTMPGALAFIEAWIGRGARGLTILAVNPEKVLALARDERLLGLFRHAGLLIPDGIGVVLAMRLLHGVRASRVAGADLMPELCRLAAARGWGVFVYGAEEAVNRGACETLRRRFPTLDIRGRSHGYVPDSQMEALVDAINASRPDILFVALGSPRQERWLEAYLPRLDVAVCQGIGGTLDTIVGRVVRAPRVFRESGLEWLYRLLREPTRIRRQAALPRFAWRVLRTALGKTWAR